MSGTLERLVDLSGLAHCSGSVKPDLLAARPSVLFHNRRVVLVLRVPPQERRQQGRQQGRQQQRQQQRRRQQQEQARGPGRRPGPSEVGDGCARVALVIIGGFLVDSVRMDPALREGAAVAKGRFLGSFALGGSAILMLAAPPDGGAAEGGSGGREAAAREALPCDVALAPPLAAALRASRLPVKVAAGAELARWRPAA